MSDSVEPVPRGMHSLTPHLVCADAVAAIDFYKNAFGAVEEVRLVASDGKLIHAGLHIGDSMIMLAEEAPAWGNFGPKSLKGTPVTIHLAVPNVDAVFAQAVAAGAKVVMPIGEMFWGDRYGLVEDPFGHRWSIATKVRNVTAAEMQKAALEFCS